MGLIIINFQIDMCIDFCKGAEFNDDHAPFIRYAHAQRCCQAGTTPSIILFWTLTWKFFHGIILYSDLKIDNSDGYWVPGGVFLWLCREHSPVFDEYEGHEREADIGKITL